MASGKAFDRKLACGRIPSEARLRPLWGGLVPGSLDAMAELHERGIAGFKAFMCDTGQQDFRPVDDATLWEGMRRAAQLGSIVAVHAGTMRSPPRWPPVLARGAL